MSSKQIDEQWRVYGYIVRNKLNEMENLFFKGHKN